MPIRIRPKPFWELVRLSCERGFAAIGVMATGLQTSAVVFPDLERWVQDHWGQVLLSMAILAMLIGATRIVQPKSVGFVARGLDLHITLKTANVFDEPASIAIPVNDFFDTEIGQPVSAKSVHGQFVGRVFPSDPTKARADVDAALAGKRILETVTRPKGAPNRYRIGETTTIAKGSHHYILFALSHTDAATCEAGATPDQLTLALMCLWNQVRACCNHEPVATPLIGAGPSRTGLDKANLLDFLLATAIRAHKHKPITRSLTVALQPADLSEIDLFDVKRRYE